MPPRRLEARTRRRRRHAHWCGSSWRRSRRSASACRWCPGRRWRRWPAAPPAGPQRQQDQRDGADREGRGHHRLRPEAVPKREASRAPNSEPPLSTSRKDSEPFGVEAGAQHQLGQPGVERVDQHQAGGAHQAQDQGREQVVVGRTGRRSRSCRPRPAAWLCVGASGTGTPVRSDSARASSMRRARQPGNRLRAS